MSRLQEPHCQCGRAKTVIQYIDSLGQRTRLKQDEPFTEPYPEGNAVTLLACANCDDTAFWPKKPKLRKNKLK